MSLDPLSRSMNRLWVTQGKVPGSGPIKALLLVVCVCLLHPVIAQPGGYSTTDKGAIKRYESGSD
ncbi:MAG: hypothetical protein KDC00_14040, partial [Flavobacteriales bacterium]|nr:hypothetical protein [Flavobacteriales bacterium]